MLFARWILRVLVGPSVRPGPQRRRCRLTVESLERRTLLSPALSDVAAVGPPPTTDPAVTALTDAPTTPAPPRPGRPAGRQPEGARGSVRTTAPRTGSTSTFTPGTADRRRDNDRPRHGGAGPWVLPPHLPGGSHTGLKPRPSCMRAL